MKSALTFCSLLFSLTYAPLFGQLQYKWAQALGTDQHDFVEEMLSDDDGNLYQLLNFQDTIDLDPGPGIDMLNPTTYTVVLIKSDPDGNFLWSGRFSSYYAVGGSMTEIKNGRIQMSLRYTSNLVYERNGDKLIDHQTIGAEGCVLTLSLEGEVLSVAYWPRLTTWFVENSHMLNDGTTIIQGRFSDSLVIPGAPTLFSHGADDLFMIRLDANNHPIWAKTYGSAGEEDDGPMAVYNESVFYFVLTYPDTILLNTLSGPKVFPSSGEYQSAIIGVNLQGEIVDAFAHHATQSSRITSLAVDSEENMYVGGYFEGTLNFAHPSQPSAIYTSVNFDDGYVARYTPTGHLSWVNVYTSEEYSSITTITLARENELYITGNFTGKSDLDPGPDSMIVETLENGDIFVAKLRTDGHHIYAHRFYGNDDEWIANLIISEERDEVLMSGFFYDTLDCDLSGDEVILISKGAADIFRIAFVEEIVSAAVDHAATKSNALFYPNPATDFVRITSEEEILSVCIQSINGQMIRRMAVENLKECEIGLDGLMPGLYCIIVQGKDSITTGRVIKSAQ